MTLRGKAWLFGDNIDTDVLAPGYLMKLPPEELAQHCLEAVDPSFAKNVKPGDIVVGGANFGLGSSREQAAISLKLLGVGCVLATSFARIFYRNAINIGLPAIVLPQGLAVSAQDELEVNPAKGIIKNCTTNQSGTTQAMPDYLMDMIEAGGLIAQLKQKQTGAHRQTAGGHLS
jgi:3-isopropylmalate/(R)-2-methylmalate dehydratase small subunit